jgi:hypothetical protein
VKSLYLSGPRTRTFALVAAWADCVLELCFSSDVLFSTA